MAKYRIKFMPEYNATSLWGDNDNAYNDLGIEIEYNTVGLSEDLINQLEKFDESVMGIIDWENPGGDSPLSAEEKYEIYQNGVRLLSLVRDELGDDY